MGDQENSYYKLELDIKNKVCYVVLGRKKGRKKKKNMKLKLKITKETIYCRSSDKDYEYILWINDSPRCLHCVLAGYCDKELKLE